MSRVSIGGKGFQAEWPGDANSLRSARGPCAQGTAGGRRPGAQR